MTFLILLLNSNIYFFENKKNIQSVSWLNLSVLDDRNPKLQFYIEKGYQNKMKANLEGN